jgi:TetR/AcrR family transcriptional regulator, fatty acid metabolism regulator protein
VRYQAAGSNATTKTAMKPQQTPLAAKSDPSRRMPPGQLKIKKALVSLLTEKEFNAITTAEIARLAGVTEALIYKYFKDKRDLLHDVLREYLERYTVQFGLDLKGIKGSLNKLRKLIWGHINAYSSNRVFARILLIEVRNHPDYYRSETYEFVKAYSNVLMEILEEGMTNGEIRDDIPAGLMRQVILGGIEHICLTGIIFNREIAPDELTEKLCELIFAGIEKKPI